MCIKSKNWPNWLKYVHGMGSFSYFLTKIVRYLRKKKGFHVLSPTLNIGNDRDVCFKRLKSNHSNDVHFWDGSSWTHFNWLFVSHGTLTNQQVGISGHDPSSE